MSEYRKRQEEEKKGEAVRGHNHPAREACGPYCPRNEHYKGRKKRFDILHKNK